MTEADIIDFAARTSAALDPTDERILSARVMLDALRNNLDRFIADMTVVRDQADRGDPIRADFRAACKHLEKALENINAADERLKY